MSGSSAQFDFGSLDRQTRLLILARRGNHPPRLPGYFAVHPVTGQRLTPPPIKGPSIVTHPAREVYTPELADLLLAVLTHVLQRHQGHIIAHGRTRAFVAAVIESPYWPGIVTLHQSVERIARKRAGKTGLSTKGIRLCTARPHLYEIAPEDAPALIACIKNLKIAD